MNAVAGSASWRQAHAVDEPRPWQPLVRSQLLLTDCTVQAVPSFCSNSTEPKLHYSMADEGLPYTVGKPRQHTFTFHVRHDLLLACVCVHLVEHQPANGEMRANSNRIGNSLSPLKALLLAPQLL